jgi:ubiquinone biosynthesis protein COQ9
VSITADEKLEKLEKRAQMTDSEGQGADSTRSEMKERLLDAALIHVVFDGWSEATFRAACRDADIKPSAGRVICPRGAVDLALAYHERGDRIMVERLAQAELDDMRLRDKIATAIRYRIEAIDDKEAVRRGSALFSLPQYAGDGARAIWSTADRIWTALGDSSDDINWYSKRASLSGVYGATVLYWLGDESEEDSATWEFLNRRVEDVLELEKVRAKVGNNPVLKLIFAGPNWLLGKVRPPSGAMGDFPGHSADPAAPKRDESGAS